MRGVRGAGHGAEPAQQPWVLESGKVSASQGSCGLGKQVWEGSRGIQSARGAGGPRALQVSANEGRGLPREAHAETQICELSIRDDHLNSYNLEIKKEPRR